MEVFAPGIAARNNLAESFIRVPYLKRHLGRTVR
jgi:hypothetical protein